MNVLALDPGAKRCGWAVLSDDNESVQYRASGILGLDGDQKYQQRRLLLVQYFALEGYRLLRRFRPEVVVSEIVPPAGGNVASVINRQLSLTAITTVQAVAVHEGHALPIQIGASTVKKRVAGTGKATKVKVRDGVLRLLPELEPRRPDWTGNAVWDEVDALAIGLAFMMTAYSPINRT